MKRIGMIGYGLRSRTMMKAFHAIEADLCVAAVADPRIQEIIPTVKDDPYFANTRFYPTADELLAQDDLDGVFIGTRCSLHTDLAVNVLQKNLPLFLEKPVCINPEQYSRLREAAKGKEKRVVVSFPLRVSPIVQEMKRIIDSGVLGRLTMVQAINNVPYGSVYYHSWYRDPTETGGLFLQKTTHDIDYINYLTGDLPVSVCAKTVKLHFLGDRPAGLRCPDCPQYRVCPESSYVVSHILKEEVQGDQCCFAKDTGNEDGASAIFLTKSGALISYNQNFTVKKSAARRGARLIGTKASIEFDFYSAEIIEEHYLTPQSVRHQFHFPAGQHFGGDEALALDFVHVLEGGQAQSDLCAGLQSAACCLAARDADARGCFVPVQY
ncbi:MAG TPA: Gfo/Idh/MocA family oxidoreductase [Candidatus Limiplasma stercoravium]|nr:Gfo/Idh/MocA family oxidoreductase [Candidatus Limiplasma stercoravium]